MRFSYCAGADWFAKCLVMFKFFKFYAAFSPCLKQRFWLSLVVINDNVLEVHSRHARLLEYASDRRGITNDPDDLILRIEFTGPNFDDCLSGR
jgi:hypothetical protein